MEINAFVHDLVTVIIMSRSLVRWLIMIMMIYNDPHITVTVTRTVREIQTSVTLVRHSIQNMTMPMTVGVIKKKCRHHNNLAITVNYAAPCCTVLLPAEMSNVIFFQVVLKVFVQYFFCRWTKKSLISTIWRTTKSLSMGLTWLSVVLEPQGKPIQGGIDLNEVYDCATVSI